MSLDSDVSTIADTQPEPVPFDIRNLSGTCDWFFDNEEYLKWLSKDHGILWIKAEAGVGKSVLMQFLQSKASSKIRGGENTLVIPCANENKRTSLGLYQSLIWNLFDRAPDISQMLDVVNKEWLHTIKTCGWQIHIIQDMLLSAISLLETRGLQIYVDSFTAFEKKDAMEIVIFLDKLLEKAQNENVRLQICFASRHYPDITSPYSLDVFLESESGHSRDIAQYIKSMLKIGTSEQASEIGSLILQRSSGRFLWATLVVSIMNRMYVYAHGGDEIEKCRAVLEATPAELDGLFEMILLENQECNDEFRLAMQWALFAKEPLTLSEYHDAVHGLDIDGPDLEESALLQFLYKSSRGLLQITTVQKSATKLFRRGRNKSETAVGFVHELVPDYFFDKGGIGKLWPNLRGSFEGVTHTILRSRCEETIQTFSDILEHKSIDDKIWKHPFLDYAVGNVIRHANSAQGHGIAQEDFVQEFPWLQWSSLANKINYYRLRFSPTPSILYTLATQDANHLISAYQNQSMDFSMDREEEYKHPLIAAVVCGSHAAVVALSSTILSDERDIASARERSLLWKGELYQYAADETFPVLVFLIEFGHVPLLKAFLMQHGDQLTGLLARGCSRRRFSYSSLPMLQFLLQEGYNARLPKLAGQVGMYDLFNVSSPEVAEALVRKQLADINGKDLNSSTVLHYASGVGNVEIVEALLEMGANVNAASLSGSTPLMAARTARIAEVLLRHGADVNARDHRGRTALFGRKLPSLIHLLLQHGADPNARDKEGWTPLHELASGGISYDVPSPFPKPDDASKVPTYFKMPTSLNDMKLLIRHGADVNIRDAAGRGPLNYDRDPDLMDLLVSNGALSYPQYTKETTSGQARKAEAKAPSCGSLVDGKCQIL